jgi:hypothetical protein
MTKRETKAERWRRVRRCAKCGSQVPMGQGAWDARGRLVHVPGKCMPLFGGSQGRSAEEIEGNATAGGIVAIAVIGFLMVCLAIGWAGHRQNGLTAEAQRAQPPARRSGAMAPSEGGRTATAEGPQIEADGH